MWRGIVIGVIIALTVIVQRKLPIKKTQKTDQNQVVMENYIEPIQTKRYEPEVEETVKLSKEILLLARVIQAESLGEPYEGMIGVGAVIMNRAKHDISNIHAVVYQKNAFSSVSRGNRLFNAKTINEDCIKAAIEVVNGRDNVDGALYFTTTNIRPSWTKKLTKVKVIGNHVFYKT